MNDVTFKIMSKFFYLFNHIQSLQKEPIDNLQVHVRRIEAVHKVIGLK